MDLPSEICGVKIPPIKVHDLTDMGRLQNLATQVAANACAHATGLEGALDSSKEMHEVLTKGSDAVSASCKVLSAGAESVAKIQSSIDPLMPLFLAGEDPAGALQVFSRENLVACAAIIQQVFDLGSVINTIGKLLKAVQEAFAELAKASTPFLKTLQQAQQVLYDVVRKLESTLQLEGSLNGISSFFTDLDRLGGDLSEMSSVLSPLLRDMQSESFASVAAFGVERWQDLVTTLQRFVPAWVEVQKLFNVSREYGVEACKQVTTAWDAFANLVSSLCSYLKVDAPTWLQVERNPLSLVSMPPAIEVHEAPEPKSLVTQVTELVETSRDRPYGVCCMLLMVLGGRARVEHLQQQRQQQHQS